ncbi:MAG TPA: ATP-binding protein, partial [Candidatus Wallbacteria bacterium]|nr:ATP-binding protein [Candidatus Wallbacteria bacterium]
EYVKTSSGALLSLINDILDLSKIEAGKLEIDNVEFELNSILDQVIGITRVNATKKGIRFTYMLDSAINFRVFSDPTRLRQVLLNLVDNAIKFTETTKNVKIIIALESETPEIANIKFMVSDEGIGIPESKIGTIFMSFMQSDTSITRKYGGTGLGLTISNHIIKLMGAEGIKVRSVEGAGSDFYFTLKLRKGGVINYSDSGHGGAVFSRSSSRKKYNILLVEDNPSNIALTTKVLIKFGHNVAVAVNGEEAVAMSLKHSYDLILMDIQMPVMDGFEATRAIRSRGDEIPIIAMTASAMKGDHEACMAVGMDGYIPKPINITEINATIETVLARASLKAGAKKSLPSACPAAPKDEKPRDVSHNDAALERAAAKIPGLVSQPADEQDLKIFDPEKLMFNMGGIKELAVDSVNMFLEYSAAYLKEVKDALDEKNPERIKRAAHKFKGTSLNACALRVANLLLKIEIISKSGGVEDCV